MTMFENSWRMDLGRIARHSMILGLCALASIAAAQDVVIREAWARATVAGQKTAGIYLEIVSSADAALIGVRCDRAKRAELHETRMENGVMKMRAITRIALPAGRTVKLAPGGLHIMLFELGQPLIPNETIPLQVTIESARGRRTRVDAQVSVRGVAAGAHTHAH